MSNGPNFPPEDHNNPYAANPYADNPNYSTPHYPYANPMSPGMQYRDAVAMVKPLAICMIILGCLEVLSGLLSIGAGVLTMLMIQNGPQQNGMGPDEVQFLSTISMAFYGAIGCIVLGAGVFRIFAGIRSLDYRSFNLAFASHFVGLANLFSCYCLLPAIGICIWGCIVHFKPEVKYAYQLREVGYSAKDIESGLAFDQEFARQNQTY